MKHCIGPKFIAIVIKATHRRSNFSETFVSQEIFLSIGLRKICFKISKILGLENVISIFVTILVNVGLKISYAYYLLVHNGRFMFFHIKGSSNLYIEPRPRNVSSPGLDLCLPACLRNETHLPTPPMGVCDASMAPLWSPKAYQNSYKWPLMIHSGPHSPDKPLYKRPLWPLRWLGSSLYNIHFPEHVYWILSNVLCGFE